MGNTFYKSCVAGAKMEAEIGKTTPDSEKPRLGFWNPVGHSVSRLAYENSLYVDRADMRTNPHGREH